MGEAADWAGLLGEQLCSLAEEAAEATGCAPSSTRTHDLRPLETPPAQRRSPRRSPRAHSRGDGRDGGASARASIQLNFFGRAAAFAPSHAPHHPTPSAQAGSSGVSGCGVSLSAHERQRAPKRKAPEGPRGRAKAARKTKESCIPIKTRLSEFPNEGFKLSAGKLFCQPCKEELVNLKEGIKRHVKSSKHKANLEKMQLADKAETSLSDDLANYFKENPDVNGVSYLSCITSTYSWT